MSKASKAQITRLQTLYSAYARRDMDPRLSLRSQRLLWASQACNRPIASFSELYRSEANGLINTLQTALGQAFEPARPKSQYAAESAGLEGRRGDRGAKTLVSQKSLDRITEAVNRLGWTPDRFTAFLASPSSPLKGRTEIRTEGDANRVWWAMKRILQRAGLWNEERARA